MFREVSRSGVHGELTVILSMRFNFNGVVAAYKSLFMVRDLDCDWATGLCAERDPAKASMGKEMEIARRDNIQGRDLSP
jgi:hypothetical protein